MIDQIESWENAAERQYDKMDQGDGTLKCGCSNIFDPDKEGGVVSLSPWAMPVCGTCFENFLQDIKKQAEKKDGKTESS